MNRSITTLEFLLGENEDKKYLDPATGELIDQVHGGAAALRAGASCTACHTTSGAGLSMEALVPGRGGVWTPTPLLIPEPEAIMLLVGVGAVSLVCFARRVRRQA